MTVDDGFSVLEAGRAEMGTKHSSKAIEVVRVPLAKVIPNPYQPRKTFDEDGLQDLAASIAQYGVLQPLLVAPMEDGSGNYLLIAGERRLRASKMAALSEIPVIISDYTQQQIAEIALIENLQREDLHYLEEAEGYEMLMNEFHLTQDSMAARVGKKQSTIANKLRLLRLPQPVRESLRKNALTERHARVLLKLPTEAEQLQIVETIVKNNFSVRQTEEYVKKYLDTDEGEVTPKKKRLVIVNDVRIYLNSIKQIVSTIKDVGIPVSMEQDVDGGIRSGVDIFKALALGADAVVIARPFVTAVFGGGKEGVKVYIEKLAAELKDTMAMCGAFTLKEITSEMVRRS